jgi:hypothetical protein
VSAIEHLLPWTQQPQEAVTPAIGAPFPTPFLLFNAAQERELISGLAPSIRDTVLTPAGYAYNTAGGVTGWTASDMGQPAGVDELCMVTWGWNTTPYNVSVTTRLAVFGAGLTGLVIENYASGALRAAVYHFPDYSGAIGVTGPILSANAPHAIGMRYIRNSALQLWVDGVVAATVAAPNKAAGLRGAASSRFDLSVGTQERAFQQAGAAVWLQDIGEAGMAALTRHPDAPWQLFEPRRIHVPVAAGGGGSWSVSLTESASASDSLAAATTALVSLIESASAADIITAATIAAVALTEAASASDTQTASYSATGSGSVTESASATDTLDAANTMLRALTETASADDQLAAATTMLRAISESASAVDTPAASYSGAGTATIEELTSATDALTAAATLLVTILEAGSATDALAAATTMVRAITEQATAVDEVTASLPGSTWDVSIEELAAAVDLITGYAAGGLTVSPLGLRLSAGGRSARLSTTARMPRLSTRTR